MRIPSAAGYALIASAAFTTLTGFSGRSLQIVASSALGSGYAGTRGNLRHPVVRATPLIFVSDSSAAAVDIYPQAGKNQTMVGQITGLSQPQGITTDRAANVYVANFGASNVLVYPPPYTGTPVTIPDGGNYPLDVAVSRHGIVGVANFVGSVSLYAPNSMTPCATVFDPFDFDRVSWDAFDEDGNLYVVGLSPMGNVTIGEVSGGCRARTIMPLTTLNSIQFQSPGGIQVDKLNRVAVMDPAAQAIYTYNPPRGGYLGRPVSTTYLTDAYMPPTFAFLASGKDLYVSSQFGTANEYDYPYGGAVENTIFVGGPSGQPHGVAATPPLIP